MKTCIDCIFKCSTQDNETCERFKDKQLFEVSETVILDVSELNTTKPCESRSNDSV
jgi:hypothetical protein